ncbi:MAG: DUF2073 domain-containing protein [Candidatus Woesearchaeota archaeon]|jgi:hypothetical protein|nr:DUF2073 domain-containing protein [Candidatus Woesearchaeota archaeon]MDP7458031.1 DUF2073 domain-containing protein [Candidatus Woesearchaeota archaeon]
MLTLQIVPYSEIADLSSVGRIRKLLTIAKQNKIVLLQGRLKKEEEAELIQATMEEINKDFKGIELAVVDEQSSKDAGGLEAIRSQLSSIFLGDRAGLTIIGPANVVKAIKKDPKKIELLTRDPKQKKKKK